jgi:hypothetical protein
VGRKKPLTQVGGDTALAQPTRSVDMNSLVGLWTGRFEHPEAALDQAAASDDTMARSEWRGFSRGH